MTIQSAQLLKDLEKLIKQHILFAEKLQQLPDEQLKQKATSKTWNALECIEHLNRYGNFYLPEIQKRIKGSNSHGSEIFKSGWLGNYFAKSMWPSAQLNKMSTFKSMNPIDSKVERNVLDIFIGQQQTMLKILQQCELVNLNKIKTNISITPLVKLRLGDTLRIVIYHNERHIRQAERATQLL